MRNKHNVIGREHQLNILTYTKYMLVCVSVVHESRVLHLSYVQCACICSLCKRLHMYLLRALANCAICILFTYACDDNAYTYIHILTSVNPYRDDAVNNYIFFYIETNIFNNLVIVLNTILYNNSIRAYFLGNCNLYICILFCTPRFKQKKDAIHARSSLRYTRHICLYFYFL